jgi:pyridoxal phosphate enzyme (YggS family)
MLEQILAALQPTQTQLVAVSKTKPVAQILAMYEKGQRHFGENKVQEMVDKYEALPKDICWHLIGHLQTNKVKYIAPFVHLIHSIESDKLLKEINKRAQQANRIIDGLLQFKIAAEDTKFGMTLEDAKKMLDTSEYKTMHHVRIVGVMGMATFTEDKTQVQQEFRKLKHIFEELKTNYFADAPHFKEISMGMSDDYDIAIAEGSTMVRIGSLLFGERNY